MSRRPISVDVSMDSRNTWTLRPSSPAGKWEYGCRDLPSLELATRLLNDRRFLNSREIFNNEVRTK